MEYAFQNNFFNDFIEKVTCFIEMITINIEEFISDLIETPGSIIQDNLDVLRNNLPNIPIIEFLLRGGLFWIASVVSSAFIFLSGLIKAAGSINRGVIAGGIRILGGIIGYNSFQAKTGCLDIISNIIGGIILCGGHLLMLLQAILFLGRIKRKLTKQEKILLKKIFKKSLGLYNMRIVEGWTGLPLLNKFAWNFGNTVFLNCNDLSETPDLLVHECTHAWQFQNLGARYLSDAIWLMFFHGDPYNWKLEIQIGKNQWIHFNCESQAEFLQDLYLKGRIVGDNPSRKHGVFYSGHGLKKGRFTIERKEYTNFASDAVSTVRKNKNWRISRMIWE